MSRLVKTRPLAYIETSVWVRLVDREYPDRRRITYRFMSGVRRKLGIRISDLVHAEIAKTPKIQIRRQSQRRLKSHRPRVIPTVRKVHEIARELEAAGCLTGRHIADLQHLGYALFGNVAYLVTWNMRDLARERTRRFVEEWCLRRKRAVMRIGTPEEMKRWLSEKTR